MGRFFALWKQKAPHIALNKEGLLPPHSWTWPEFQELHLNTPWDPRASAGASASELLSGTEPSGAIEVADGALPVAAAEAPEASEPAE